MQETIDSQLYVQNKNAKSIIDEVDLISEKYQSRLSENK
jgi:hypothetical protein